MRKFATYRGHRVEIISDPRLSQYPDGEWCPTVDIIDTDISAGVKVSELSDFDPPISQIFPPPFDTL